MKNSLSTPYTTKYFLRFNRGNKLKNWLLSELVDKKQPIFAYLKSKYKAKSKLLDFACGCGRFAKHAVKHFDYYGIDISADAIKLAKHNAPLGKYKVGSLSELKNIENDYFEVITCFDILEHVEDIDSYLKQIYRLIKNSGVLVIAVPVKNSLAYKIQQQYWFGYEDKTHIHLLNREEWGNIINKNGFEVTEIFSSGIVNSSSQNFKLSGFLLMIHYITQTLGILAVRLPVIFSDEDYFVCTKKTI